MLTERKRRMTQFKKHTSLAMASLLATTSVVVAPMATNAESTQATVSPKLLITELVRDSKNEKNAAGKNFQAYEFLEVYNNTQEAIDLKDYVLQYGYPGTDKAAEDWSISESLIIEPGQAKVIWIQSKGNDIGLTVEDFNHTYNSTLTAEDIAIIQTAGIHGTNARSFTLVDHAGTIISAVMTNETGATTTKGEALNYAVDGVATKLALLADEKTPTPGSVLAVQLERNQTEPAPEEPKPEIIHTAVTTASTTQPLQLSASLSEPVEQTDFTLYYRPIVGAGNWMSFDMDMKGQEGIFEGTIPNSLFQTDAFEYKIVAQIGSKEVTSQNYIVDVAEVTFDAQKAPELLITELLPNSKNYQTPAGTEVEGYEFIEVYNNSVDTVDLQDYTIQYQGETLVPDAHNVILAPGEAAVYWLMNEGNRELTVADFNAQYGTNMPADKIIRMDGFMTNSSKRTLSIISNTGDIISTASYYDQKSGFGIIDTATGTNVQYAYPQDGTATMVKYDYLNGTGTPGQVEHIQVPNDKVNKGEDTTAPLYEDVTNVALVNKNEPLTIQYAIEDNRSIKTAQLFYRFKGEESFESVHLKGNGSSIYAHQIAAVNLLNKQQIEYYVEISDGLHNVTTDIATVAIEAADLKTAGFNLTNGASVGGKVPVEMYQTAGTLTIAGQDVTAQATQSLADDAHFVFEGAAIDNFFQNGVTVGDEVLSIYNVKIPDFKVLATQIAAKMVKKGETFKVDLRAGTKIDIIDEGSTAGRDDFKMKNPKLILADGTAIFDKRFTEKDVIYNVGDSSATALPTYTFEFDIPEQYFSAMKYEWDTTTLADGEYEISDGADYITVKVDNTAPIITPTIEEKSYKGPFTIDANMTDLSDVTTVHATLDGEAITLPYKTGSGQLAAGEHSVVITATDSVGNEATQTVNFTTAEEQPIIATPPTTNVEGTQAVLTVGVEDPQQDEMDVAFYKGYRYAPGEADTNIEVYEDTSFTEPPRALPLLDDVFVTDETAIAAVDKEYLSVSSNEEYPYHRFAVTIDKAVKESDQLHINWTGKSLKDRKVSMYVWNYTTKTWDLKTATVAQDSKDFELTATFAATKDYVQHGEVQVVVQDEIAATDEYDYSFAWISDTQYYSESYPEIFDTMTTWLADKRQELGIEYVFHTGDLVDEADKEYQWQNADKYMGTLDKAGIPYGVLAGNHDVAHTLEDYSKYGQYFGEQRFNQQAHYGGSYENNRGHYDVLNIKGTQYVMLYMGWGVGDDEVAWMNDILAQYPDAIAFLNFHDYLTADATRSPIGDKIYKEVVVPNKNVQAVLSGHIHDAETLIDEIDDNGDGVADRKVYQMLADYQGAPQGGLGYLRLLKVNQQNGTIAVETYSPYLDDYNYYDEDDFPGKDSLTMSVDYSNSSKEKRVETNAFSLEVLTDEKIGDVQAVKSGHDASFTWQNLQPETPYSWYATVTDAFGGRTNTIVTQFRTGKAPSDGGGTTPPVIPPVTPPMTEDIVLDGDGQTIVTLNGEAITLTTALLAQATKLQETLQFVTASGVQATFTPQQLAQLQQANEQVKVSISEQPSAIDNATTFANTVTVNVLANNQPLMIEDIEVIVPASAAQLATTVRYNALTKAWEYNGGFVNDSNWHATIDTNTAMTVAQKDVNFPDITTHWAKVDIETLAAQFIINGKEDGTFAPSATLTRSQFTLMLARVLQLPVTAYEGIFADVKEISGVDALQIEAAYRAGITTGKEDGMFAPTAPITRQQMTAMLIRAVEQVAPELLQQPIEKPTFVDAHQISDYAQAYVSYAVALGLVTGREDGTFAPKENASRAHAAAVVHRFLQQLNKQ